MEKNLAKGGSSGFNRPTSGRVGTESNVHQLYSDRTNIPVTERENWRDMLDKLYNDTTRLWQKESQLIRTEMNEKISEAKTAAGSLVGGATVLFVGLIALAATGIIALDLVLELWVSALIVSALLFIVGGIMVAGAKKKLAADKLRPNKSVEALNEIKTTFKERVYEFKKH